MASYVDNSFRQAVMKNPAERTQQVRINDSLHVVANWIFMEISSLRRFLSLCCNILALQHFKV